MKLKIKKLDPDLPTPHYATEGAAGIDLYAAQDASIMNWKTTLVPTGVAVEIPPGYEGQLRCRSGLGKKGVGIPHGLGTIDSDYRGEIGVVLAHLTADSLYDVKRGDRIAQLVIAPVVRADIEVVENLSETERGKGGFGHTGK